MSHDRPTIRSYLDEVSAHLGRRPNRRDILLELESAILDRAEDFAEGAVDEASIQRAIEALGDPAEVALAYAGERYLVGPRMYRPFVVYTGIVFLLHLTMILVASVTHTGIEIFPVSIMRVAHPHSFLNLCFVAAQALLMDIGLMVLIFSGISRARSTVRMPSLAFRTDTHVRSAVGRAVFALLVLVILNFFRDDLFIVVVDDVLQRSRVYPMFSQRFAGSLVLIDILLGLSIAKDICYAFLGERRFLVALHALLSLAGVALMIHMLAQPQFISFPTQVNVYTDALPTLNQLMNKVVQLILIAFAAGFALQTAKRFVRLRQIWL